MEFGNGGPGGPAVEGEGAVLFEQEGEEEGLICHFASVWSHSIGYSFSLSSRTLKGKLPETIFVRPSLGRVEGIIRYVFRDPLVSLSTHEEKAIQVKPLPPWRRVLAVSSWRNFRG